MKRYVLLVLPVVLWSCGSSLKDKITAEKQSIRVEVDSLQKELVHQLKITEHDIDSVFAGNDSLIGAWRISERSKRTMNCIDRLQEPFASHQDMVRIQIDLNKSMGDLFFSSFRDFFTRNKHLLPPPINDFVFVYLNRYQRETDLLIEKMDVLAIQYEILYKVENEK